LRFGVGGGMASTMPIIADLDQFARLLPKFGSLLALDISKRRIGFAGTDVTRLMASPVEVWRRRRFADDLRRIEEHMRRREAIALVIGFPLEADGRFGPRAQAAKDTAKAIDAELDVPIWLQDERWSTVEAADRGGDDATAATVVLEDTLKALAALEED
jgi:putative Holliday junction resolvase